MKIRVIPKGKPYRMVHMGIGPIYAEKNGSACLITETSWHKVSGFWINTNYGCVWIYLRRAGKI